LSRTDRHCYTRTILFQRYRPQNIGVGLADFPDKKIRDAARAAMHKFIEAMPEGFESIIGESRHQSFPAGQRAGISIAARPAQEPSIMIFDESDVRPRLGERFSFKKPSSGLMRNRTSLVIAHRLSHHSQCRQDYRALKKEKSFKKEGMSNCMKQKNGLYKRLCDLQFNLRNEDRFDRRFH